MLCDMRKPTAENFHYAFPLILMQVFFPLFLRVCILLFLACIGILYPYNRGRLLNYLVLLYVLSSIIAGYSASSFHAQFAHNRSVILHEFPQHSALCLIVFFTFQ